METKFGDVVDVGQDRPVIRDPANGDLVPGNITTHLDLLLRNSRGEVKAIRVPVSNEVGDFFAER